MLNFGKVIKGKVVHVIVGTETREFYALCEKGQTNVVIDKSLSPNDVTCAKCKQYKIFKDALVKEAKEEEMKHGLLATEGTKQEKKKDKKEVQKVKNAKDVAKKVVPAKESILDFQKEKKTDGTFQIIHGPSGLHFFDKIEKEVVDRALGRLNRIELRWEVESGKPPKGFISQCRKALRIAYNQAGIEIPNVLTKQNDPVEGIKKEKKKTRKEEKTKKTIKRRDKKTGKEKKVKKEKEDKKDKKEKKKTKRQIAYEFIQEQMVKGISISNLISLIVDKFDLTPKKANSKVKGNLRRFRKGDIEVMVRLTKNKSDDFYKIVK